MYPWHLGLTGTERLLWARHNMLDCTGHRVYGTHVAGWWFTPVLTPMQCIPQDAAHHGTPAAPAGTGEDHLPLVCRVCDPALPALLPLPTAVAVPEALLAILHHLPPAALLPPAAPAQLVAGPPGHGVCGPGRAGLSRSQVFRESDGLLASHH